MGKSRKRGGKLKARFPGVGGGGPLRDPFHYRQRSLREERNGSTFSQSAAKIGGVKARGSRCAGDESFELRGKGGSKGSNRLLRFLLSRDASYHISEKGWKGGEKREGAILFKGGDVRRAASFSSAEEVRLREGEESR